jgi:rhodanese-related sulfurtransferase
MSGSQIFLAVLGLAVLYLYGRQLYLRMAIKHYGPTDLAQAMKQGGVVVVDVRTKAERAENNIPGSIHLPLTSIRDRRGELERYRNQELVFYCASGNRSLRAAAILRKQGYSVANLKGGIGEWNFHNRR